MADPATAALAAPADTPADAARWYKDAIIYQLHIKAFYDSNADGVGDFRGLTEKLDYIRDLGVNTIWLLPFYPSPLRDDGYDVADYRNVNPLYGTRADFQHFVREAHKHELRVITELIVNHTSDQHPWFQAARRAPKGSNKRNYYVWSDDPTKYSGTRIIFTDTEKSNWAWDDVAKAWYWHRFFSHQPDLNFDNPQVLKAIFRVMRFWLDMGVDGFRLDAIPYLCEREGTNNENLPETHAVLKRLRALIDSQYPNVLLLAEANQWPEDVREYFGDADECHMAYHFPLMPRMYMAIAQEERHPITEIMAQTPDIPPSCQWAIFLRNHDELTLENDMGRIKLMNSLLLSMPGSPTLYYGDEIGMGDNIYLGDRDAVRTPMQWAPERNAGFSRTDPQRLYLQPIMDPVYGYEAVNVEAQWRAPSSLLHWTRRMLEVRKGFAAFGRGTLTFLRPENRKILAYLREYGDETILCVANLARTAQPVELDLGNYKGRVPIELLGRTAFPPIGDVPYLMTLAGHAFLWFRLASGAQVSGRDEQVPYQELPVLVLFDGWASLFRDRVVPWRIGMSEKVRHQLETDALPAYVASRRWYAAKSATVRRVEIADHVEWKPGARTWLVTIARVDAGGEAQAYFLPLTLAWEDFDESLMRALSPMAIAKVRQQAQVGVLADAFGDEAFVRALVAAVGVAAVQKSARGTLHFRPTTAFAALAGSGLDALPVTAPAATSSNTIAALADRLFVKGYRRLQVGVNPEVEIGRYLTEVVRFRHSVPVAGSVDYVADDGRTATLALVQGYVQNQGDGWDYTHNYLERFFDDTSREAPAANGADVHGAYTTLARTLGMRTADLHLAFAQSSGDPAFDPEPMTPADVAEWTERVRREAMRGLERLERRSAALDPALRGPAEQLLAQRDALLARIARHATDRSDGPKTRVHGDYHLGQVLLAQNDFVITDFEGEPARPLAERARKQSPLKDVAGMLRSFDYALHAALFEFRTERGDVRERVDEAGRQWRTQATRAFLDGYDEIARAGGLASAQGEATALLELFVLEKALYELGYEADNRPEWLGIPIHGLLGVLDGT